MPMWRAKRAEGNGRARRRVRRATSSTAAPAAISIARGSPSSRLTTPATSSSSISTVRSGAMAAARSNEEPPPGARGVGGERATGRTCSPSMPSALAARREHTQPAPRPTAHGDDIGCGVEHVLRIVEHEEHIKATGPVEPSIAASPSVVRPSAAATASATPAVSRISRELDEPSAERSAARAAARGLDRGRVLPTPPVPTSVTIRAVSRSRQGSRPRRRDRRRSRLARAGRGGSVPGRGSCVSGSALERAGSAGEHHSFALRAVHPTARARRRRAPRRRVGNARNASAARPCVARPSIDRAQAPSHSGSAVTRASAAATARSARPARTVRNPCFGGAPPQLLEPTCLGAMHATSACSAKAEPGQRPRAASRIATAAAGSRAAASRCNDSKHPASTSSGAAASA